MQSRKHLDIALEFEQVDDLAADQKLVIYRVTQEALNNTVKYAQASQVAIRLSQAGSRLTLNISDDGVGFDVAEVEPTSMGLNIMRERAEHAGAVIDIASEVGRGTHITVIWQNNREEVNS